ARVARRGSRLARGRDARDQGGLRAPRAPSARRRPVRDRAGDLLRRVARQQLHDRGERERRRGLRLHVSSDGAAVWRRRDDVLWRRPLDAVILMPEGGPGPVTLPGTGAAVWDVLEVPSTLTELVATLAEVYAADSAVVEHDITVLLAELESLGAVTRGST